MNTKRVARWLGLVLLCLSVALALGSAVSVRADGPNRVALVVSHGSETIRKCVEFSEDEISGYEVLERSEIDMNIQAGSDGAAICRLDNKGCTYPQDDCFCQCQDTPCIYWSYWHLKDGEWRYSSRGASNYDASNGDVEGWSWGEGEYGQTGTQPPLVRFEDICTSSGVPAPVSESGDYVPGTGATGGDLPTIDYFNVDRTVIAPGESVTLSWDLHNAQEAYLRVDGQDQGVVAPWTMAVAPAATTEYVLIARNEDGEVRQSVRVEVNPDLPPPAAAAAPPTDTPLPPPTDTPLPPPPTATPLPPPPPTDTPLPLPTDTPPPAEAAAPAAAATPGPAAPVRDGPPTLTPRPTRTPVPVAALQPTPFIMSRRTPEMLVRTPPPVSGSELGLVILLVGGGLGIAGGLVGAGLLFAVARRSAVTPKPDPRRRSAPVRRSGRR